jgi:hypothetical protein
MTAARVIASVEPLLAAHVKMARRHGLDEIRIPLARAIGVMHELQHLRDSDRRAQRFRRDIHPI